MGYQDEFQRPPEDQAGRLKGQEVSLGCGTLILIALIVMFFSGRGINDVKREIREMRDEMRDMRVTIDAQSSQLRDLEAKIDTLAPNIQLRPAN